MRIDIITLFPDMFTEIFSQSILKRAQDKGLFEVGIHNLRDYSLNKNHNVDDYPYGGGAGMVMQIEPVDNCLNFLKSKYKNFLFRKIAIIPLFIRILIFKGVREITSSRSICN